MAIVSSLTPYLIGFFLGYLSNLLAERQTRREKNLCLDVLGREIIFENFEEDEFELKYKRRSVENLYVLVVRIWNKGKDRVIASDISSHKPIVITMDNGAKILGTPKVYKSNEGMCFNVSKLKENAFKLDFDCLNGGEHVVVEFKYTGSPKAAVSVCGRVFGQRKDVSFSRSEIYASRWERLTTLLVELFFLALPVSLLIAIVWIAVMLVGRGWTLPPYEEWARALQFFTSFGAITLFFLCVYLVKFLKKRFAQPKGYVSPEDLQYSNMDAFKASWRTVFNGKRYRASNSIYDYGQIVALEPERTEAEQAPAVISHNGSGAQMNNSSSPLAQKNGRGRPKS